jgi:hypothetical protein
MRLTWKDAVTTLAVGAIVAVYVTYLTGTSAWLISTARGTTTAVLVLGLAGGCALAFTQMATDLGMVALAAAIAGLITGGMAALAVLVAATIALWLTATVRHVVMVPRGPARGRDVHEVIHPEKTV